MASEQQVKNYLAYWFLLGKKVVLPTQTEKICPRLIYQGASYSTEFEELWHQIVSDNNQDAYLEGTEQTIRELLSSKWEIVDCAKCQMPVPIVSLGMQCLGCPCSDLNLWPNNELPLPKSPINNQNRIRGIQERLNRLSDNN